MSLSEDLEQQKKVVRIDLGHFDALVRLANQTRSGRFDCVNSDCLLASSEEDQRRAREIVRMKWGYSAAVASDLGMLHMDCQILETEVLENVLNDLGHS